MSAAGPLASLHHAGTTWLHRLPIGVKVVFLALFSVVVVAVHSAWAGLGFLTFTLALALSARVPVVALARATRPVLLVAVFAAALQWWWYGRERAIETFFDLLALALIGTVVAATTSVNAMLDAVVRWLGPLRVIGVNPERIALSFALAIGALPGTVAVARETRDAARARGLERSPRANVTPFVTRVVARALITGDALHARGVLETDAEWDRGR